MKRCKLLLALSWILVCWAPFSLFAQETKTTDTGESLQIEKLKLEIEQLKLENQRLELKVKTLEIEGTAQNAQPTPTPVDREKEAKRVAKETSEKAAALAKENASNGQELILDLCSGEIWYKNVHYKIPDLKGLFEDQKWDYKTQFLKNDINGDSENRFRYKNVYLDRYDMQPRGVLVIEAPLAKDDLSFLTPEGINETSTYGDIRNKLETPYYRFDHEEKKDGARMLCFKHGADFLGFDDVLEVYFDKMDHFLKLRWGMLDKK